MRILLSPVAYRTGSTAGAVSQYGFTLIEMLIAVAVLAALTALAAPYLKAPTTEKLHEASAAIADMYRYARDKSIGTGQRRAVMVETKNGEVLFAVLTEGDDEDQAVAVDQHPITHGSYEKTFATTVSDRSPVISTAELVFDGTCSGAKDHIVAFDRHGIPRCVNPYGTRLLSATIVIELGGQTRTVKVEPMTGRVTEL